MPSKVITEIYKSKNANDFYNSLDDSNFYTVASGIDNPNGDSINSLRDRTEFLRRVIFGSKVTTSDARFLFRKINWIEGKIFDQYDDIDDLTDKDFYVSEIDGVINDGDYKVFKCISNNNGSRSTINPTDIPTSDYDDGYFKTQDGYVWKFMFAVTSSEYTKYQTEALLPFNPVKNPQGTDGIYNVVIENNNQSAISLFENFNLGECKIVSVSQDADGKYSSRVQVPLDKKFNNESNSYKDMYIEIEGSVYEIIESFIVPNTSETVTIIKTYENPNINGVTPCFIKPKIEVSQSNGGGSRCLLSGILDQFGTLIGVTFNSYGSDYTAAEAKLVLPKALRSFEGAVSIRPIISPPEGHNSDPAIELKMSSVGVVTSFFTDLTSVIPGVNTYTKVGLLRNPEFNPLIEGLPQTFDARNKATVLGGDVTSLIDIGYYLVQDSTVGRDETVYAKIHDFTYDEENDLTEIYLIDYDNPASGRLRSGETIIKEQLNSNAGATTTINSIDDGDYITRTGELYHFVSFDPITRTNDNIEKVKFIFDF